MSHYRLCRLCKATEFLNNLFKINGDTSIDLKISSCVDIKVHPEDGLPAMICKACTKKINKFYRFKLKCLEVDEELRNIAMKTLKGHNNEVEKNIGDQNICQLKDNFNNDSVDMFYCDETVYDMNLKSFEDELFREEPTIIDKQSLKFKEKELNSSTTQCELCGFIFNTKDFKKHFSSHSKPKLFQCQFCPKQFTRSESNVIHMRSHMGIKPFICEICGQSSTKRQDLIRHMKIHSDEKKHTCLHCGRQFKRSGDLCSHRRTHTGVRPYKCRLCEKDYTSHGGLRKHYKKYCKRNTENIVET